MFSNKFGRAIAKKKKEKDKSTIWLLCVRQIKMLYMFVTYLREIYLFGKKKKFLQQNYLRHGSQKTDLTVKNGIFGEYLGVEELIGSYFAEAVLV